jgi:hypothetical protein
MAFPFISDLCGLLFRLALLFRRAPLFRLALPLDGGGGHVMVR